MVVVKKSLNNLDSYIDNSKNFMNVEYLTLIDGNNKACPMTKVSFTGDNYELYEGFKVPKNDGINKKIKKFMENGSILAILDEKDIVERRKMLRESLSNEAKDMKKFLYMAHIINNLIENKYNRVNIFGLCDKFVPLQDKVYEKFDYRIGCNPYSGDNIIYETCCNGTKRNNCALEKIVN